LAPGAKEGSDNDTEANKGCATLNRLKSALDAFIWIELMHLRVSNLLSSSIYLLPFVRTKLVNNSRPLIIAQIVGARASSEAQSIFNIQKLIGPGINPGDSFIFTPFL